MHELAIVQDLLKLCETNALEQGALVVLEIEISIGKLSGVEPHYLRVAFDTMKEGTMCANAELKIKHQNIKVFCEMCGYSGEIFDDNYLCPECSSNNLTLVDGEEIFLDRIKLE